MWAAVRRLTGRRQELPLVQSINLYLPQISKYSVTVVNRQLWTGQ